MSPDKVQARKMVLASLFVLALVSLYKDRRGSSSQGQQGTFRTLWGVGIVGIFLSLLADFLPQIAGPFALLIVLGSLTHGGDRIISQALGLIGKPIAAQAPSQAGTVSQPTAPAAPPAHTSAHPVP